MALAWPIPTSSVLPLSFEVFRLLSDAVNERIAAVQHTDDDATLGVAYGCVDIPETPCIPALSFLTNLRKVLLLLAPRYVDFGREDYSWQDYLTFPRYFTAADLLSGEHSLAALPPPGAYEFDEDATEIYRTFVENAVWWIRRFRYAVAERSFYAKRLDGGSHWSRESTKIPFETPTSTSTGTVPFYGNSVNPSVVTSSDGHWDYSSTQTVHAIQSKLNRSPYLYITYDETIDENSNYQLVKWNDYRTDDDEILSLTCYRDLNVTNYAPFDADVLLVARMPLEYYSLKALELSHSPSFEPLSEHRRRYYFAELSDYTTRGESTMNGKFGGVEKPTREYSDYGSKNSRTVRIIEKRWSPDGAECIVVSDSTGPASSGFGSESEFEYVRFFGQGFGSTPGVIARSSVGANQTIKMLEEEESIRLPFEPNEISQVFSLADDTHPWFYASLDVKGVMSIVPILDFHDSFRYP